MQTRNTILLFMSLATACGEGVGPTGQTSDSLTIRTVEPTPLDPIGFTPQCGGAGMSCCGGDNPCGGGLECNPNGICRQPCGGLNERCCGQDSCAAGLQCRAGSCRFQDDGNSGPGGPDECTPCAIRECGWDTSCGPLHQQYCGGCTNGKTCNAGFCEAPTGQSCSLTCPAGMSCQRDAFGMYCDF